MKTFDALARELGVSRDWLLTGASDEERGIAQDVTEMAALRLLRQLDARERVAALSMLRRPRSEDVTERHALRILRELSDDRRSEAISMLDALASGEDITSVASWLVERRSGGRKRPAEDRSPEVKAKSKRTPKASATAAEKKRQSAPNPNPVTVRKIKAASQTI